MRIYLDTDRWNFLCDSETDPPRLLASLDGLGWTPVFGQHVLFEMLKNFPANSSRGQQLFRYVHSFSQAGLRCVAKDVLESIAAEMHALKGINGAEKFLGSSDISHVVEEVRQFSLGRVKGDWFTHLFDQASAIAADRARIQQNLEEHPHDRAWLLNIKESDLQSWLDAKVRSELGNRLLLHHLIARFPTELHAELKEYARELLGCGSRSATALVKADLYTHWRCAQRGSIKKDLLDDSYHVLSSAYCHAYATGERKQAEYASILLSNQVSVVTYPRGIPLDIWLSKTLARLSH